MQIIKSHLKTAISEVQDMGSSVIGLTGGEPLLRNDLEDIIPCIDNRSMLIIFTTGYKLTRERVRRLKEAGLDIPVISLDHYKAEIHDKGRRRQGMFEYALNAIRMFQEEEFYVAVSFYEDFPCLTLEAAEYLALMKIKLLGLDTPSPSPVEDPNEAIHKTLLDAGIVIVQAIEGLTLIGQDECEIIVLPPMLKGFSGAPCRVLAVVEN